MICLTNGGQGTIWRNYSLIGGSDHGVVLQYLSLTQIGSVGGAPDVDKNS